jgi:hypothetical protein
VQLRTSTLELQLNFNFAQMLQGENVHQLQNGLGFPRTQEVFVVRDGRPSKIYRKPSSLVAI